MLRDFVINAGMLIAFLSICYQIFGDSGLNSKLPVKLRLRAGLFFGIMGVILVEFSVKLYNHLILDLRIIPIFIATLYGGFIPGILASLIIAVFRMFRFGFSYPAFFAAISMIILPFILFIIFSKQKKLRKSWIYGIALSEAIICLNYAVFIPGIRYKIFIILAFVSITSVIAYLLYYYVGYLEAYTFAFRKLKAEANRDFLTGLNNVRQFDTVYNEVIEKAKSSQQKFSLLFLDIDFFKKVNDTYGHKDGDTVLKALGKILVQSCRSIDIVSRNGGEEFSVILLDSTPDLALEIAERMRSKVENTPFVLPDGIDIKITISVGVACYPGKIHDLNIMREKADEALYAAKRSGRNKVVLAE